MVRERCLPPCECWTVPNQPVQPRREKAARGSSGAFGFVREAVVYVRNRWSDVLLTVI
jgi:hypothetical protein